MKSLTRIWSVAVLLLAPTFLQAQQNSYSPAVDRSYPTNVYWGDTHVHTSLSSDANARGNRSSPSLAYRFARGDVVEALNGEPARIRRPLDFLVVADHASQIGIMASLQTGDQVLRQSEVGRRLYEAYNDMLSDEPEARRRFNQMRNSQWREIGGAFKRSVWQRIIEMAEEFNDPGTFTTFSGYEWSSGGSKPGVFGNLHRVVIFKDSPERTSTVLPFGGADSRDPEDLWRYFARYEEITGGEVLAIPHNGNLSNGEMFALTTFDGQPLTSEYARARSRWEPLYEVTQIKGDSETHPVLSPNDEFAGFEAWNSWAGTTSDPTWQRCCKNWDPETQPEMKKAEYARSALKRGLALEETLGVNPFKFGLIGSTDSHTSLATADNDNFWGKHATALPNATRMLNSASVSQAAAVGWEAAAAG